jgi:hypothetical protein
LLKIGGQRECKSGKIGILSELDIKKLFEDPLNN